MHCYGIVPGPILSTYVLGVRRDRPVWEKRLIIEPHLADLSFAKGTVVTEFGPVPVEWRATPDGLRFEVSVPDGVIAELALPARSDRKNVKLDGKEIPTEARGNRLAVMLRPGTHRGEY